MDPLDFIYKRHSIRTFTDEPIPMDDIKKLIHAATYAPSGKNNQNWHFVIIKNKDKIQEMAKIVERKNKELVSKITDNKMKSNLSKFVKYHTAFKNAPVVILVYSSPYPSNELMVYRHLNASQEVIDDLLKPNPGIQNIGAAMENLLLAATTMGYGTCWMTGPLYARKELESYINLTKEGYFLTAMTPLGIPADDKKRQPPRKPIDEVITLME